MKIRVIEDLVIEQMGLESNTDDNMAELDHCRAKIFVMKKELEEKTKRNKGKNC